MGRSWYKPEPAYTAENKAKLNAAFKCFRAELRALARQNYMCCMGCGTSAGWQVIEAKPDKYKCLIFYHAQDADGLRKDGEVCLRYSTKDGGADTKRLGERMCDILRSVGLNPKWNGDPDECITLDLTKDAGEPSQRRPNAGPGGVLLPHKDSQRAS